jgi:hypothetical protein
MALIIRGSTKCAVCGRVLAEGDDVTGLPHFSTGPSDPHWRYSDAGFHVQCWERLPERDAIESRIVELDRQRGYPSRFGEQS